LVCLQASYYVIHIDSNQTLKMQYLVQAILVFLYTSSLSTSPANALRGDGNKIRSLQLPDLEEHAGRSPGGPEKAAKDHESGVDKDGMSKESKVDKEGMPKEDKDPKHDKEDKVDKEGPPPKKSSKKSSKKSKKSKKEPCKKANKGKNSKSYDYSNDEENNETPRERYDGNVHELGYCSQGQFSGIQCSNLETLPNDGTIRASLRLELVHAYEKDTEAIVNEFEHISRDTQSRFVGCMEMNAPPPPKENYANNDDSGRIRRQRRLQSEYEVIFKDDSEKFEVTGVEFSNLNAKTGGCTSTEASDGLTCNMIESNVDIHYRNAESRDPNAEDIQDMKDLLVETIVSQANAGAFIDLGSLESVEVADRSQGGTYGSQAGTYSDGDEADGNEGSSIPIIIPVILVLLLAGLGYWFCCRNKNKQAQQATKRDDTSDEEPDGGWTTDDNGQEEIPVAQVVAVEDPSSTGKDKPRVASSAPPAEKAKQEDQGVGGWFEWIPGTEADKKEKKEEYKKKDGEGTKDESSIVNEAGCTDGFGLW